MSNASDIYRSLTPQQRQFVDEKTISATFKIDKWISFFSNVSKYDKLGDQAIKKYLVRAIICFVIALFPLFLIGFLEWISVVLIAILVSLGFYFLSVRKRLKAKDVNDYMRLFFLPVLHVLREKAGEDTKLAATLDFRIPRSAMTPQRSKVSGRNLKLYQPQYIIANTELNDGSSLAFVIGDDIKDLSWTKRSASGKTKFKRKTKFTHHCMIKMTLLKSAYRWSGNASDLVSITEDNDLYVAKTRIKIKTIGKNQTLAVKAFFDGVQAIYNEFEPLNAPHTRQEREDGSEEIVDDVADLALPYIWYGSHFDQYDYDSFDHSDTGDFAMDDDSATVFDS